MNDWPGSISAISLFVADLARSRSFYQQVFGLTVHFKDDESVVFRFGDTLVNLLIAGAAPGLIAPATLAPAGAGATFQLTVTVDDVDSTCADLMGRGVELLNGPMDRPWGIRTASFADPDGYLWEVAS